MLVLSRKVGQEIMIGENIRILVSQIGGKKVRLGVAAPATVPVQREEIRQRRAKTAVAADNVLETGKEPS